MQTITVRPEQYLAILERSARDWSGSPTSRYWLLTEPPTTPVPMRFAYRVHRVEAPAAGMAYHD